MKIFDSDPQVKGTHEFKVHFDQLLVPQVIQLVTVPPCPEGVNIILWEQLHRYMARAWPDIRRIICDNAIKDMQAEEDAKFFKITAAVVGQSTRSSKRSLTCRGGSTRSKV